MTPSYTDLRDHSATPKLLRIPLVLIWFSVGLFLAAILASFLSPGPVVQADEGSYLLNAAAIAGKLKHSLLIYDYFAGYSLLLSPAYMLFSQFDRIYHATLVINALLIASLPFALYRLMVLLRPGVSTHWHVLAACAASCYAPILVLSQYALSDNALIPVYAWALMTGAATLIRPKISSAFLCGAFTGALFLIHARGTTMALPLLLALSLPALKQRHLRLPISLVWVATLLIATLHFPLEHLAGKALGQHFSGNSVGGVLDRFMSSSAWGYAALNVPGVITGAIVSSAGLLVLALRSVLPRSAGESRLSGWHITPSTAVEIACVAGLLASISVTAAFFTPPLRADHMAYGRYVLPTLIPLIALGMTRLAGPDKQRRTDAKIAIVVGVACIAVMAILFRYLPHPPVSNWLPINAIGLFIPYWLAGARIDWIVVGVYFIGVCVLIYGTSQVSGRFAAVFFAAVNLAVAACAIKVDTLYSRRYYASGRAVVSAVRDFEAIGGRSLCISLDPKLGVWQQMDLNTRLFNYTGASAQVDSKTCVRGIIAPLNAPPKDAQFKLAAIEARSPTGPVPIGLFVQSGPALDRFVDVRALPVAIFTPLPEGDRQATLAWVDSAAAARLQVDEGHTLDVEVRVTNADRLGMWPVLVGSPYPIRIGARVNASGSSAPPVEYRSDLSRTLAHGDSEIVHIKIGPFGHPGPYQLMIGVLQERVAWFSGALETELYVIDP